MAAARFLARPIPPHDVPLGLWAESAFPSGNDKRCRQPAHIPFKRSWQSLVKIIRSEKNAPFSLSV
jgi:hypothetical protein